METAKAKAVVTMSFMGNPPCFLAKMAPPCPAVITGRTARPILGPAAATACQMVAG